MLHPSVKGSIVNTITGLAPEVDFQILVSVYNPNMLDAKIESGTAILYHKHLKARGDRLHTSAWESHDRYRGMVPGATSDLAKNAFFG